MVASAVVSVGIVIAIDHPIIRNNLRLILEREPDFQVIAEGANGREAVVLAEYKRPQVVVLDVMLPHVSGVAAAREIHGRQPDTRIIFVSAVSDEPYLVEAFRSGGCGYVAGDSAPVELVQAVRRALDGNQFISPSITEKILEGYSFPRGYERDVMCLSAAGSGPAELSIHLGNGTADFRAKALGILEQFEVAPVIAERVAWNIGEGCAAEPRS